MTITVKVFLFKKIHRSQNIPLIWRQKQPVKNVSQSSRIATIEVKDDLAFLSLLMRFAISPFDTFNNGGRVEERREWSVDVWMPKVATNSVDMAFIPYLHEATTTVVVKALMCSVHVDSNVINMARLDTHCHRRHCCCLPMWMIYQSLRILHTARS